MGLIFGWLSKQQSAHSASSICNHMLASVKPDAGIAPVSGFIDTAGVGGSGQFQAPSMYRSDTCIAIIEGHLHWQDSELCKLGQSHDSAYVLVYGYNKYGKSVLNKMHGEFALALLRPDSGYILLAIDRVGRRPLAYYAGTDLLVFASSLEQISAHPEVQTEVDPQGIYNYLYFHMLPSPGSIYHKVKKLQPAEYIESIQGKISQGFYWQISYSEAAPDIKELETQLHAELKQAVSDCQSASATGTFLSGGIDSSTVTGIFQSLNEKPVNAFSMGFDAEGYDEMAFARTAAEHFGATLHEYYVTPQDVLDVVPLIAAAYDEPFGNASAIPAYYCAKLARQHGMSCLLAGDGGDEIFAGNARYAKQQLFDLYRLVPEFTRSVLEPLAARLSVLRKVNSYIDQARLPMPERMETYNFLHRTPPQEIFSEDFLRQVDVGLPLANLAATYQRSDSDSLLKSMLFLDAKFTLADNDLRKVNRMCELAGVDVRYPMLQENLLEFAARIPDKLLMRRFQLRSFFRNAMVGFLPVQTLQKNKQGFGLPFGVWMNTHAGLKEFAIENLTRIEQRGIFNPAYIRNIIKAQQEGHASYYGVMIWLLIMLEQWLSAHDEQ